MNLTVAGVEPQIQSPNLVVRLARTPSHLRILLEGELDALSAIRVDHMIREQEQSGFDVMVVDLSSLRFMDSSGFGTLVAAARRASLQGRYFRVVKAQGAVRRLFDILQADAVFLHLFRSTKRTTPSTT